MLKDFELEVLELMLHPHLPEKVWAELVSTYSIEGYNFTSSGYFLKVRSDNVRLSKYLKYNAIYKPTVIGVGLGFEVGFILYVEESAVILECHSWSDSNPPENIRDIDIKVIIDKV